MKRVVLLSMLVFIANIVRSQQNNYNCLDAYIICSNDPIAIGELNGAGVLDEVGATACYKEEFTKTNSIWFKWEIGTPGELGFSIMPLKESDDIDFVLYKMNGEINDCISKTDVRCMVSGQDRGEDHPDEAPQKCLGATGLSLTSVDKNETPGCTMDSDNFLAPVLAKEGDIYALFINNYYSSGGFLLEFSGSARISPGLDDCKPTGGSSTSLSSSANELVFAPIFPNPARSEITLPITAMKSYQNGTIQLSNLHGDILRVQDFNLVTGTQNVKMHIGELPVGVYFIKTMIGGNAHIARFSKF